MFEHLLEEGTYVPPTWGHMDPPPTYIGRVATHALLEAKFETAKFLEGIDPPPDPVAEETATAVFGALASDTSEEMKRDSLTLLRTPDAVKHLISMLTAYEWQFVEEAQRIRGYVVAKLLEETKHDNARIRLRALEMLGKVTEVALFTDRVEVRRLDVSDEELEKQLRAKMSRLLTADAETIEALAPSEMPGADVLVKPS